MRKSEREVVNFQEKMQILMRCGSMTLAFQEQGGPYLVPLNFGAEEQDGSLVLYFHCALEGKKLDLLKKITKWVFVRIPCCACSIKAWHPADIRRITKV